MEEVALGLPAVSLAVQPRCPLLDVSTSTRPSACALDASLVFRSTQWLLPRWKVLLQCSLECRGNSGRAWATALNRDHSSVFQSLGKQALTCFKVQFYWLGFTETESHVTQASLHFTLHTKMIVDLRPPPLISQLLRSHTGVPHPCHVMQWRGNLWFTHSSQFRAH